MNPTIPSDLMDILRAHAPHPTPHTRTVRTCVRGRREFGFLPMGSGNGQALVELEATADIAAIMEAREAVEV